MSTERKSASAYGWLFAAVLTGCNGSSSAAGGAASASASASPPPPPVASASAPTPSSVVAAPAPVGDLTSPVANGPQTLKDAVSALTHKISEYGGRLGVAVLDVQTGELLAAQNDRR